MPPCAQVTADDDSHAGAMKETAAAIAAKAGGHIKVTPQRSGAPGQRTRAV
jgi:TRAP-type C4-dicarboxylate transport system substrate-binding protein